MFWICNPYIFFLQVLLLLQLKQSGVMINKKRFALIIHSYTGTLYERICTVSELWNMLLRSGIISFPFGTYGKTGSHVRITFFGRKTTSLLREGVKKLSCFTLNFCVIQRLNYSNIYWPLNNMNWNLFEYLFSVALIRLYSSSLTH